jgi:hypothetical protein
VGPVEAGPREEVRRLLDDCLEQAAALLDEGGDLARDEAFSLCVRAAEVGRWLAPDRAVWRDRAAAALGDRPGAGVVRDLLEGDYCVKWAWDARGTGLAPTVTEEGWRLFGERLRRAEAAYERAWAADPTCAPAAVEMITVCKGLGRDRDAMEVWFRRAMEADGDSLDACHAKTGYLLPKWHGSVEEVVSFGRQCRDTGNWAGGLPLALVHAHKTLAVNSDDVAAYFAQPVVRRDVESVYRPLLEKFPGALCARTNFFMLAVENDWPDAREQFEALRGDYWKPVFKHHIQYRQYRDLATRSARPPAGRPGP